VARRHDDQISRGEDVVGQVHRLQLGAVSQEQGGHVGVVVADFSSMQSAQADDVQGRGLADVVDVGFVGDAEDEDLRSVDGFLVLVQDAGYLEGAVVGHVAVDVAGEFD